MKAKKSDKKETKNLINSEFRAPIDLICVLDISGSMSGKKMYFLNETMGFIINHLQKIDRIAIVAFNDKAQRVTRLRRLTPDGKIQIKLKLEEKMKARGETNIALAMDMALAILD